MVINTSFRNSRDNRVLLIISSAVVLFWVIARTLNVYYFILTGAIFELLSIPTLILLFGLPLYCFYAFWKDRFNLRSFALHSALLLISTILVLVLSS